MSIFVCCDPGFVGSGWAKLKFDGINAEAARKRIPVHYVYSRAELERYHREYETDPSTLILMSTTNEGVAKWLDEYKNMPLFTVVFSNHDYPIGDGEYSTVMTDIEGTTKSAIDALRNVGCRKIALFGINREGGQDRLREAAFLRACGADAPVFGVDRAPGVFKNSFRLLLKHKEPIDGILVSYDYPAFRLVQALKLLDADWQKKLRIIAIGGMPIGELMTPSLSSVSLGFAEGAQEVVALHRMFHKTVNIVSAKLKIRGRVILRESTEGDVPSGMTFADYESETERILSETAWTPSVDKIEEILTTGDATDLKILLGIVRGESLEAMAEKRFLSLGAIKYRIRGFRTTLNVGTTEELRQVLLRFFKEERIAAFVREAAEQ